MSSVATINAGAADDPAEMIPIALAALRIDTALNFDLYLAGDGQRAGVLYRERRYPITQEDVDALVESGVSHLYTSACSEAQYHAYLTANLDALLSDEQTPPLDRYKILHECARSQLHEAYRTLGVERVLQAAQAISRRVADLIARSDVVPADLLGMIQHDMSTFTHMMNVATYAALLARLFGCEDSRDLARFAIGGMLHDLGKRAVPRGILGKQGALSPGEQEILRRHPRTGFEELCERPDMDWDQLMMVYQHHESLDGSGYPVRIPGREIHWTGRMCAVVDVFDALSCRRPYRKPMHRQEVLEYLETLSGKKLDAEMVRCWNSTMKPN